MANLTSADYAALAANIGTMPKKEQKEALKALSAMIPQLCKEHYWYYVWYTNRGTWQPGRFHLFLCNEVQRFIETDTGNAYDVLLIHTPPQHGKSLTITNALPSWFVGKYPDKKVILASYNDETSLRFTKENKDKIRAYGKPVFNIEIDSEVDRAGDFKLLGTQGYFISRGLGGGITSYGADLLLIDDPIKSAAEADSEPERMRQWASWNMDLRTRLAPGAKVILIMTLWHEDDLAGKMMKNIPSRFVTVLKLPCEAEENDLLGRKIGEPLAPEIGRGGKWLADTKESVTTDEGQRGWNAQYQCRPTSQEGNMLKRHWWRYWKPKGSGLSAVPVKMPDGSIQHIEAVEPPDWMDEEIQSWDCTFKDTKGTDKVSGGLLSRHGSMIFLRDRVKDRMDIVRTMAEIKKMSAKWPKSLEKLVEDKANGPAVIQLLRNQVFGLIAVNPQGGKVARVNAVSPAIEAGNVYLPHPSLYPWVHDLVEECAAFPNGAHDDDVDMLSQGCNRLIYHTRTRDPANKPKRDDSPEGFVARHLAAAEKRYKHGVETECV